MVSFNLVHSNQKLNSNRHSFLLKRGLYWMLKCIKNLSVIRFNRAGRGSEGHIVCRTKGARNKIRIRLLCVRHRSIFASIPSVLLRIEYAPNRSANLGVLYFLNDVCYYTILTDGLSIGDKVRTFFFSYRLFDPYTPMYINKGDNCDLFCLSVGDTIHSLELLPHNETLYITSAGCFGLFVYKFEKAVIGMIRLPSGLMTDFSLFCYATKGIVCNVDHKHSVIGQAGRNRRLGLRPIVRGVARNPVDHPHGGGEGKKSPPSCKRTAWGKMLMWCKTTNSKTSKLKYV